MGDVIGGGVHGVKEVEAALAVMDKRVDAATLVALKKVTANARTRVRGQMNSRPRWDRRGNGPGGPAVNLDLSPHGIKRSGGPGKLDGVLRDAVKKSRKPRVLPQHAASAVVFVGGAKANPQVNWYKARTEAKFPYFAKGIKKAEAKMPAIWNTAWAKAIKG
jgi:hypothetical protein